MTGNQMMDYHVRPWHLYSHDRKCTRSGLPRISSRLVAFHICYLLDCASVHEMSALVTRFQFIIRYLHPLWRSWFIVYCTWQWPHMTFVYHAYSWPLYSYVFDTVICVFAVICRDWLLYYTNRWMVLPLGYSSLHFWDGFIMYFGHHVTPLTSHAKGHLL